MRFYETFLARVAEGRDMTRDEVHAIAQGRVWTGRQAQTVGLVDELGGFDRALAAAKREAGIEPDRDVTVVRYPRPRSFFDLINSEFGVRSLLAPHLATRADRLAGVGNAADASVSARRASRTNADAATLGAKGLGQRGFVDTHGQTSGDVRQVRRVELAAVAGRAFQLRALLSRRRRRQERRLDARRPG